jgi:hypothetical protein
LHADAERQNPLWFGVTDIEVGNNRQLCDTEFGMHNT